jgi:DNA-binding response OmpR family regulator
MPLAGKRNRVTAAIRAAYILLVIQVQDICLDPETRRVWRGDEELKLSRKEFDLLHKLISNAGTIVTREELMQDVWATRFWTSSKTIDVHLGWVRRKIGDDSRHPHLITTVRGKGLRFEHGPVRVA